MWLKNPERLSKWSLSSATLGKNFSCQPLWIIFSTLSDLERSLPSITAHWGAPIRPMVYPTRRLTMTHYQFVLPEADTGWSCPQSPREAPAHCLPKWQTSPSSGCAGGSAPWGGQQGEACPSSPSASSAVGRGASRTSLHACHGKDVFGLHSWLRTGCRALEHHGKRSYGPGWLKAPYVTGWRNK